MATAILQPDNQSPAAPALPARVKLLCVTTLHCSGGWIAQALAAEGAHQAKLDEVVGGACALARMREEVFDAVLVLHEPGVLDAPELVEAIRTGGHEEPVIVLGQPTAAAAAAACRESGADAYCCIGHTTPQLLLWELSTAMRRCERERENRTLLQAERQRLSIEHKEAERLLAEQRGLLMELDSLRSDEPTDQGGLDSLSTPAVCRERRTCDLPEALVANYRGVLRAYVIMGAGNLTVEMSKLAELLAASGVSAQRAMQLHLDVLEQLVHGLGARSARHVMNRADLLILELMIHLADGYRRRYQDVEAPPEQMLLPGFGYDNGLSSAA